MPAIVRLDELTPEQRAVVLALIDAAKQKKTATPARVTAKEVERVSAHSAA